MKNQFVLHVWILGLLISTGCPGQSGRADSLMAVFDRSGSGAIPGLSKELKEEGDRLMDPILARLRRVDSSWTPYRIEWLQRGIVRILGIIDTPRSTELLIRFAGDPLWHEWGRAEAIKTLASGRKMESSALFLSLLSDTCEAIAVRDWSARGLGMLRIRKAIPVLSHSLKSSESRIRSAVVFALGEIGGDDAAEALQNGLLDPNPWVRLNVYSQLCRLLPKRQAGLRIRMLNDTDWAIRREGVSRLAEMGDSILPDLKLLIEDANPMIRWKAVTILGRIQSEGIGSILVQTLEDPDWRVRNQAALILQQSQENPWIRDLIQILKKRNGFGRLEAAWILGMQGTKQAVPALIRCLGKGSLSWTSAMALGRIKMEKAVKPLSRLLAEGDVMNRRAAAWALRRIGSKGAVEALARALTDEDEEVRFFAKRSESETWN